MTQRKVEILNGDNYPEWDSFVASSPQGTIFQKSVWIDVVCRQFRLEPRIITVREGDEITAGVVLFFKKKFGIPVGARPPLTSYNGVLFSSCGDRKPQKRQADEAEMTGLLLEELEKEVRFAQFSLSPSIADVRPYQWHGWNAAVQFTYRNSLDDIPAVWEGLSQSMRRKINRGREKSFVISEDGSLDTLLALQELSYARSGLHPVMDNDRFRSLCSDVLEKGLVRIFSISDAKGTVHSSRAVVLDGRTAFDWIAGSNPSVMEENGTHLLLWEIFERLSRRGFREFDFLGANTPSIVEFKRSFGGTLVNYYDILWQASKFISFLLEANNLVLRFRRRLR